MKIFILRKEVGDVSYTVATFYTEDNYEPPPSLKRSLFMRGYIILADKSPTVCIDHPSAWESAVEHILNEQEE